LVKKTVLKWKNSVFRFQRQEIRLSGAQVAITNSLIRSQIDEVGGNEETENAHDMVEVSAF